MKYFYLLLITAIISIDCIGQSSWQKTFDLEVIRQGSCVGLAHDGNYYIAGSVTTPPTAGGYDVCLNKVDPDGNIIWSRIYGTTDDDFAYQIAVSEYDSSISIMGRTGTTPTKGLFLKIDKDGNQLWSTRSDTWSNYYDWEAGSVQPLPNGSVLFSSRHWLDGTTSDHWHGQIYEFDASGNEVHARSVGNGLTTGNMNYHFGVKANDGGFVSLDWDRSGDYFFSIQKQSSSWVYQWEREFDGPNDDFARDLHETTDGGFIICGSTNSYGQGSHDPFLLKLNSNGTYAWMKTYGSAGDERAHRVQQTSDGGFIVTGYLVNASNDVLLFKTDANGALEWAKQYGNTSVDEQAYSVAETADGGFIVGADSADYAYIIKTDSLGNAAGCNNEANFSGFEFNYVIPSASDNGGNSGASTGNVTLTQNNRVMNSNEHCFDIGCSMTSSAGVTSNYNGADVSCNGDTDGEATATPTGGTSPYTYDWSSGGSNAIETGLGAGTYTVTITDDNGCTSVSTVTLNDPPAMSSSISAQVNVDCFGNSTGEATAAASGGTGSHSYAWSSGGSAANETGLGAGTYTVTITDDNGCTDVTTVTITQPTNALTATTASTQATCAQSDGTATVNAGGGTSPYGYQWDANAGNQTTQTATGLAAGNYDVTVTDDNGCTTVVTATVTNPNAPTASIATQTDIDCFGDCDGEATATQTGGQSPYTYSWSNGGSTDTETGLCAGTYTITVTDANNCDGTTTVTITEPPALSGSLSTTPTSNASECDGQATVTPSGGTSPYTYEWDDTNTQTTQTATGLCAGQYCVTVTDANGCTWDTCGVDVAVGVELLTVPGLELKVYPNPNDGRFTIEVQSTMYDVQGIRIMDVMGREIASLPLTKSRHEINLSEEPAGVYFLQVETEKGTLVRKVIIE